MHLRRRDPIALLLAATIAGAVGSPGHAQQESERSAPPAAPPPLQIYVLAGQSNMLEMGNVSGGNSRHSAFFVSADANAEKGVHVSAYAGAFDPEADYDDREALATKTVVYDGMAKDPFPPVEERATYVARGFLEVEETGTYTCSPGYGGSTYNLTRIEGREVHRRMPGQDAVRAPITLIGKRRYPFETVFLTPEATSSSESSRSTRRLAPRRARRRPPPPPPKKLSKMPPPPRMSSASSRRDGNRQSNLTSASLAWASGSITASTSCGSFSSLLSTSRSTRAHPPMSSI